MLLGHAAAETACRPRALSRAELLGIIYSTKKRAIGLIPRVVPLRFVDFGGAARRFTKPLACAKKRAGHEVDP